MELLRLQIPLSNHSYVDVNSSFSRQQNSQYKDGLKSHNFDEDVHGALVTRRSFQPFDFKSSISDKKRRYVFPPETSVFKSNKPDNFQIKTIDHVSKQNSGLNRELEITGKSIKWNEERLELTKFHNTGVLKNPYLHTYLGHSIRKTSSSEESIRHIPLTINEYLRHEDERYYANEFAIKKFLFQRWLENLQRCNGKFYPIPSED